MEVRPHCPQRKEAEVSLVCEVDIRVELALYIEVDLMDACLGILVASSMMV